MLTLPPNAYFGKKMPIYLRADWTWDSNKKRWEIANWEGDTENCTATGGPYFEIYYLWLD